MKVIKKKRIKFQLTVWIGVVKFDDPYEIEFVTKDYFENDNRNLVKVNNEVDDETIAQTEAQFQNRVFFHLCFLYFP